jgi:hypothetical protein
VVESTTALTNLTKSITLNNRKTEPEDVAAGNRSPVSRKKSKENNHERGWKNNRTRVARRMDEKERKLLIYSSQINMRCTKLFSFYIGYNIMGMTKIHPITSRLARMHAAQSGPNGIQIERTSFALLMMICSISLPSGSELNYWCIETMS